MSASLVVGPGTAAYGAAELKQAAHKYGFSALVISILIHFCVIGFYYVVPRNDVVIHDDIGPTRVPSVDISVRPEIPGVYKLPPVTDHGAARPRIQEGTPTPVADTRESLEKTIPTQYEIVETVDPRGTGQSDGGTKEIEDPIVDDNVPPDPTAYVEKYPEIVRAVRPTYPSLAIQAGLEGKVVVKVWVDKQGKPRQVAIHKSDYDIFNDAALDAAKQYLFTPAYVNSGPVSVWVAIPFTFKLTGAK